MNKTKLTSRQWKLYNLLKSDPNKWFTQKEIADAIPDYNYTERKNDKCSSIREDKIAINASIEVEKIIVMKNYCFKIGNEKEYREERRKHISRLKNQKREIENIDYKYQHNNQGKLISNQGAVIDEKSKARHFFETFVEEEY